MATTTATKKSAPAREEKSEEKHRFEPSTSQSNPGDLMLFSYWGVVVQADPGHRPRVDVLDVDREDNVGFSPMSIQGESLVNSSMSAQQYGDEEKISATALAQKVLESHRVPFTVCFDTKTKAHRVLSGRLRSGDGFRGYADVEELVADNKPKAMKDRIRQVDLRQLHYLIVDGVKYVNKTPPKRAK